MTESAMPHHTAGRRASRPVFFRYAKMIATVRKASNPSRKTMISAWSIRSFPEFGLLDHAHTIRRVGVLAFAPAGVADTEDLKVVKSGGELLFLADRELQALQLLVVELDDAAAGRADQM